jgi:hypothetical protein
MKSSRQAYGPHILLAFPHHPHCKASGTSPLFSCILYFSPPTHSVLKALMHLMIGPYLLFLILSQTLCVLSLALTSLFSLFVALLECMSPLPF